MPAKAKVKIKKIATRKVAVRKSKKASAPKPLNVGKKIAVKKKTIKKKIISRKLPKNNILNSFKASSVPYYIDIKTISAPRPDIFAALKRPLIKATVLFLIVMLNWFGLAAVGRTLANFNDTETSEENIFQASALDFSLSGPDFSPAITPSQNATSTVNLQDDGLMDFTYGAEVQSASGTLCDFLELEDNLSNVYGPLGAAATATTTFSAVDNIIFDARLTSASKALQNQMCEFKFVFDGEQTGGAGFSDTEEISRTITTGEWPNIVINKVYYDPDETHSGDLDEWKYEWIELYNPFDHAVNLKDWQICDNTSCKTIHANVDIPALGYALLSHDNSVWEHYWEIPEGVETINLGNATPHLALANTADMLVLLNSDETAVDQMNWGTPSHGWANYDAYSAGVWEPGVADADEGHMLGRVPSGFDTDSVSDWQDLELPEVTLIYPVGGEKWYVGQTYNLRWIASSTNASLDEALKIDLYYSNNSGNSWAAIATSTENDGIYTWKVPLFLDYGHYYVPSPKARIKVVATGPENFMVQTATSSKDFCPPIDYDALGYEEQQLVDQLVRDGVIDESEVIRGGVSEADILAGMESEPEPEIILEENPEESQEIIIDAAGEIATTTDVIIIEPEIDQEVTVEIMPGGTGETPAEEIISEEATVDETPAQGLIDNQEALDTDEPEIIEQATEPALEPEAAPEPEPVVEAPPAPEPSPEPASVPEPAPDSAPAPEAPATN
jgi:predicted ribosomally synthesized peptide with SipW-like signal peptide